MKAQFMIEPNLWRGSTPECVENVEWLKTALQIRTIINLQKDTATDEVKWCKEVGIDFHDLQMNKLWPPPNKVEVAKAICLMSSVIYRPMYIHCVHGTERTGFVAAAYRMQVMGWSFDKAYDEMIQRGCRWPHSWIWKSALREWSRS